MVDSERETVPEEVETFGMYSIEGSLVDVAAKFNDLLARYPNGRIEYKPIPYEDAYHFVVEVERPETDQEMELRLKRLAKSAQRRAEQRRELYRELKAEFEGIPI